MDVSKFNVLGAIVNIKDAVARHTLSLLNHDAFLTECIILGDSYSRSQTANMQFISPNLGEVLASMLKCNLHHYGVSGAGYCVSGNTFASQLNNAISDTSYDHTRVKYVIVIGGLNDLNMNPNADVTTASRQLVNGISNAFTNAEIIIVPNYPCVPLTNTMEEVYRRICDLDPNSNTKVRVLYENVKCLLGYSELISSDNVHPNAEGYNVLAKNIYSMINGSYYPRGREFKINSVGKWNCSALLCFRSETHIRFYGFISATATITGDDLQVATISPDCVWGGPITTYLANTNGGNPLFRFNPGFNANNSTKTNCTIELLNDMGTTIHAGDIMAVNVVIPLMNL